jgi:hypothetical protein
LKLQEMEMGQHKSSAEQRRWLPGVSSWLKLDLERPKTPGSLSLSRRLKMPKLSGTSGTANSSRSGALGIGGLAAFAVALVTLGLLGGAVWWLLRSRHGQAATTGTEWKLGPWPLDPGKVSTREQVIRAFEYLAVLLLGRKARCRNHCEIAAELLEGKSSAAQRPAVRQLAALYKQARYAPVDEPLSDDELATARRGLVALAALA